MKIEYICHSALLIETKDVKILTDPWLTGPAYCNQWHLFPKPVNIASASEADVILISHGHEDHLHHESLLTLNKETRVYYPFQWQKGVKEYLGSIGYSDVVEAISDKSYRLSASTKVTFIANSLDSIMVVESEDEVLVNINDALPANHRSIIVEFVKKLKKRWPKVNYLFCGYGSAAYFPNTVHCEGKNDLEVAEAREQMFGDNFCYIVNELNPGNTIPFAADYVLLNNEKRWINKVKYSKDKIKNYYDNVYKGKATNFITAHSGDVIENNKFSQNSKFHALEKRYSLDELIDDQMKAEIRSVNEVVYISESEIVLLEKSIHANIARRSGLFSTERLSKIKYTIKVTDISEDNCFFVDCSNNQIQIKRTGGINAKAILVLETTSKILNYSINSVWGGDAIVIGYGVEIDILDKSIIESSLDIVCVRLLTNQPVASRQMIASPFRALRYLISNPLTTSWAIKQTIDGRNKVNKNPVNERSLWLRKTKCEICQVCDIPMLSSDFGETLK